MRTLSTSALFVYYLLVAGNVHLMIFCGRFFVRWIQISAKDSRDIQKPLGYRLLQNVESIDYSTSNPLTARCQSLHSVQLTQFSRLKICRSFANRAFCNSLGSLFCRRISSDGNINNFRAISAESRYLFGFPKFGITLKFYLRHNACFTSLLVAFMVIAHTGCQITSAFNFASVIYSFPLAVEPTF